MRDLYNNINIIRALSPAAGGTTGTGRTSGPLDRRGYESAVFAIHYGAITATGATVTPTILEGAVKARSKRSIVTATGATVTPTILEGDTTGGSFTSVADDDLEGTESAAAIAAGTPRASGTNMNVTKRIGYKGVKRYLKIKIVPTATAASPVGADLILGHPNQAPVA